MPIIFDINIKYKQLIYNNVIIKADKWVDNKIQINQYKPLNNVVKVLIIKDNHTIQIINSIET